jgi:hypothetical protein
MNPFPPRCDGDPEDDEAYEYNRWLQVQEQRRQEELDDLCASHHIPCGTGWV